MAEPTTLPALRSAAENLALLPEAEKRAFISETTPGELEALQDDWNFWARPNQRIPDHLRWRVWLVMAGRGFGKTRIGAETVKDRVRRGYRRIALVGATAQDVRDTMVEGESGILNLYWKPHERPIYEPSKARVIWPNGAIAKMYSAEKPNRLRGPQHEFAWADEIGAWRYKDAWDQLMLGLRIGDNPQCVATTTPKPIPMVFALMDRATSIKDAKRTKRYRVLLTQGSTYENRANLTNEWFEDITDQYGGTRLGRQELDAELLRDVPGALWTLATIDAYRVEQRKVPHYVRIVIGVDPGGSSTKEAEEAGRETGIVAVALGTDGHYYVMEDQSGTLKPHEWARRVTNLFNSAKADRVIAEKNFGGEMVESTLRTIDKDLPVRMVNASRGKAIRAEPISTLYEQGKVHHVGAFGKMESEMTQWVPALAEKQASPNRLDALVWAITALKEGRATPMAVPITSDAGDPYDQ